MRRSDIFLGVLLLVLGIIFLGINYNLFNFDLYQVSKFWPVLVIFAGISQIVSNSRSFFNPASTILLLLAIPLSIYYGVKKGSRDLMRNFGNSLELDGNGFSYDSENGNMDEDLSEEFKKFDPELDKSLKTDYQIPLNENTKRGKFELGGGGAEFDLNEMTGNSLFRAKTDLKSTTFKLSEDKNGDLQEVKFDMTGRKGIKFDSETNENNKVSLYLNSRIPWTIDLGIGASDVDFDFSKFKIDRLNLNSGAADVKVKLGESQEECRVEINTGVANVELEVPKNVGCKIKIDGILNSNNFSGFSKNGNGEYTTSNYGKTSKSILIEVNSALSNLDVERY